MSQRTEQGFRIILGEGRHFPDGGVFLQDDLAIPVGVNLQGVAAADNMDIENLVPLVFGRLDKLATQGVFDARLKIYGILQLTGAQKLVDIRLKLDFEVILVDLDAVDDEPEVVSVELFLGEDVSKDVDSGFRHAVDAQDGVAPVREQVDLMGQPFDLALEGAFHLVVGFFQQRLLIGVLHDVSDALALGGLELLVQVV